MPEQDQEFVFTYTSQIGAQGQDWGGGDVEERITAQSLAEAVVLFEGTMHYPGPGQLEVSGLQVTFGSEYRRFIPQNGQIHSYDVLAFWR